MKKIALIFILILTFMASQAQTSAHDFNLTTIDGEVFPLTKLAGKKALLVNVASKCGYTPQYEDLQNLHSQFGEKVVVIGIPANNFGSQEPGSNLEIASFCEKNYGVTFQMMEKIDVIGKNAHPLYQWLEKASGASPKWNFSKYLIDENGAVIGFFPSGVNPLEEAIVGKL